MPIGICKLCFKPIAIASIATLVFKDTAVCDRCYVSFSPIYEKFTLLGVPALAIYEYDQFIKEQIYLFKGCHDFERKHIFLDRQRQLLRLLYLGYSLVPVPSWPKDDEHRGFNHVTALFSTLRLPILNVLSKTRDQKQASLSYSKRQDVGDLFIIKKVDLTNKRILLVDDVMTSGASLRACLGLLKTKNPKKIKILVLAKTKLHDK